jgi:hypothetical protein
MTTPPSYSKELSFTGWKITDDNNLVYLKNDMVQLGSIIKKNDCIKFTNLNKIDQTGVVTNIDKRQIQYYKFDNFTELFDFKNLITLPENDIRKKNLQRINCPIQKILAKLKNKNSLIITKSNNNGITLNIKDCIKFNIEEIKGIVNHNKEKIYQIIKIGAHYLNTLFKNTYKNEFDNIQIVFIDSNKEEYKLEINDSNRRIINSIEKVVTPCNGPSNPSNIPDRITYIGTDIKDKSVIIMINNSPITLQKNNYIQLFSITYIIKSVDFKNHELNLIDFTTRKKSQLDLTNTAYTNNIIKLY